MSAIPANDILPDLNAGLRGHGKPRSSWFDPPVVIDQSANDDIGPGADIGLADDCMPGSDMSPEYAEGFAAGKQAAEQQSIEMFNEAQASLEQQIEAARQTWVETEGQALAQMMSTSLEALREEISAVVAETLEPVLRIEMHCRVMDDLADKLKRLTESRESVEIEVRAPEDLLASVRNAIQGDITNVVFQQKPEGEIELRIDDTLLRTEIELWGATLAGAMR